MSNLQYKCRTCTASSDLYSKTNLTNKVVFVYFHNHFGRLQKNSHGWGLNVCIYAKNKKKREPVGSPHQQHIPCPMPPAACLPNQACSKPCVLEASLWRSPAACGPSEAPFPQAT